MEYAYVMDPNLCADFWTIEGVTDVGKDGKDGNFVCEHQYDSSCIVEEEVPAAAAPIEDVAVPEPYMFNSDSDNE